jgi:hypothetical protein
VPDIEPVMVSPATNTPAVSSVVRVVSDPPFTTALAPDVEPVTLSLFEKVRPTEVVRLRVEPVILCVQYHQSDTLAKAEWHHQYGH